MSDNKLLYQHTEDFVVVLLLLVQHHFSGKALKLRATVSEVLFLLGLRLKLFLSFRASSNLSDCVCSCGCFSFLPVYMRLKLNLANSKQKGFAADTSTSLCIANQKSRISLK